MFNSYKDFERAVSNLDILDRRTVVADLTSTSSDVKHGLGKIPRGYIVVENSVGGVVYSGTGTPSVSHISLRATVDGQYKILIY